MFRSVEYEKNNEIYSTTVRHLLPLVQVVINVPDRVAVLTSHPRNDDVIGAVPWKLVDELQELVGDLAIGHVA